MVNKESPDTGCSSHTKQDKHNTIYNMKTISDSKANYELGTQTLHHEFHANKLHKITAVLTVKTSLLSFY